ncbi:hypothetical protein ABOM_007695 [Aspergillus bombycis]|uniref:Aromatic prenyltransferase n=1 Tax=Aspergillus bombycis TaxID=109264 RepID=A0A1F7ZXL9_9EURO|nr:hypothetical protein ABOM_007695 [Aspergillus bombycis]OGM44206.1 hypothetical protein ABOM_007695 [Aspergillus bombycis]
MLCFQVHRKLVSPDSIPLDPRWSPLLAPYLENGLIHATKYSSGEICRHVAFFIHHIGPHLGPGPLLKDGYQPQYPSSMTRDLPLFELSVSWKYPKQQGKAIVRFVNGIIPPNRERTQIWKAVSHTLEACEATIHPSTCSQGGPSSTFIGFELKESVMSGKLYWPLPSCLDVPGVINIVDQVFSASSAVFSAAWHQIREQIRTHPDTLIPCMISIDATAIPDPRIIIYVRRDFQNERYFGSWEHHLRFNDCVAYLENFRSICCGLWNALATNPPEWAQSRPDAGSKISMFAKELGIRPILINTITRIYEWYHLSVGFVEIRTDSE